ncbi:MAG TPA: ABC transporter permease [Pseudolabrys sp.]|nr:ABC transporter permease [Pseudolabrys sp.]
MRSLRQIALGLSPLVVLLVVWQLATYSSTYSNVLLPRPIEVWEVFAKSWPTLLHHTATSLARVLIGLGLAFVTAVPLGLLIGRFRPIEETLDWTIQIFRCLPGIALIPLAILFFGIGDKPAIMLIWFSSFWPLVITTIFGVKNVERTLLKVSQAAMASNMLVFKDVILPSALPSILTGLRLSAGAGWLTLVSAEMIAVKSGLGYMIMYAQVLFKADEVLAGIILIGLVGLAFDQAIRLLRQWLCRWQEGLVLES